MKEMTLEMRRKAACGVNNPDKNLLLFNTIQIWEIGNEYCGLVKRGKSEGQQ